MNVMDTDIHMSRGTAVADLHPVEIVSRATTSEEDKFQAREKCIDDLVSGVDSCLPAEDLVGLRRLLTEFQTILSMGQTDIVTHHIDTADHRPLRQTLRQYPLPHQEAIKNQTKLVLEQNIIEPAVTGWASNVVLVRKND